jgi:hypothetical protein
MLQIVWRFTTAIALLAIAFAPTGVAFAGDCDGTTLQDTITCAADPDPVNGDAIIGLDAGADSYVQNDGVTTESVHGDSDENGVSVPGNGYNDHITINGTVLLCVNGDTVDGNGGNDTIIIGVTGLVGCSVAGDDADNGGNDTITINGEVTGDVYGDYVTTNGGNDTITINGEADFIYGDYTFGGTGGDDTISINANADVLAVYGDGSAGAGGNDTINIYGYVDADVDGEDGNDTILIGSTGDVGAVYGSDGQDSIKIYGYVDADVDGEDDDDVILLAIGSEVGGTVYGGAGTDVLQLGGISQADLDALALDPNLGSITIDGITYYWEEFESLVGLLQLIAQQNGWRVFYSSNGFLAVEDAMGISVFGPEGRIAYIPFDSAALLQVGASQIYQAPNSIGWNVNVKSLGADPNVASKTLYQVNILFGTALRGSFTFAN